MAEFQSGMAEDLKLAPLLRMRVFAEGARISFCTALGTAGQKLKRQYMYLQEFGDAIATGELSEKQILSCAKSYGSSARTTFFKSEKLTCESYSARKAKRILDSQSRHCDSCLGDSTGGLWFSIDQVELGLTASAGDAVAVKYYLGMLRCPVNVGKNQNRRFPELIYTKTLRCPTNFSDRYLVIMQIERGMGLTFIQLCPFSCRL